MAKDPKKSHTGQKRKGAPGAGEDEGRKKRKVSESSTVSAGGSDDAFPRGGGSILTPMEIRSIHQQAKEEVLFGAQTTTKEKRKQKRAPKVTRKMEHLDTMKKLDAKAKEQEDVDMADNELVDDGEQLHMEAQAPKKLAQLTFQKVKVGMSVLCSVREIRAMELRVSLPNHLVAVVPMTELSDEYTDKLEKQIHGSDESGDDLASLDEMFSVGDLLCGVISSVQQQDKDKKDASGRKKIEVTLRPSVVNKGLEEVTGGQAVYGAIKVEEDHGFIVSFGVDGMKNGFLSKHMLDKDMKLYAGQPYHFSVRNSYKTGSPAVPLCAKKGTVAKAMGNTGALMVTLNTLRAGMLVKMNVNKVLGDKKSTSSSAGGLFVQFLDYFAGTIDSNHLRNPFEPAASTFQAGQKLVGRVLFVDYHTKKVALTLVPHLVAWQKYDPEAQVGDIFNATIKAITPSVGMGLTFEENSARGFVHISNTSDEHITRLEKQFSVGKEHKCRVVGVNYVEGLLQVTFKKSILEQEFLQFSDVAPGQVVKCTVSKIGAYGLVVDLTSSIHGLVPFLHLADATIRKPEAKFKIGQKLRCRVLTVDVAARKIKLTNKRSLVNTELPILTSYADATPGTICHGYIAAAKSFGCIIAFYNNLSGLVPVKELAAGKVTESPEELFTAGQVVRCKVLRSQAHRKKLICSLDLEADDQKAQDPEAAARYETAKVGDKVEGTVTHLADGCVYLSVDGVRARVQDHHLSDIPAHCAAWKESLKEGTVLKDLVVLQKNDDLLALELTHKPSFVAAAEAKLVPSDIRRVKAGSVVTGYVRSITNYGIFVGFLGQLIGLVQKKEAADKYVTDVNDFVVVGQTVRAYVLDIQGKKVSLSLKQSLCQSPDSSRLLSFFKEEEDVHCLKSGAASKKAAATAWKDYQVGFTVEGTVEAAEDFGVVVDLGPCKGFAIKDQCKGVSPKVGDKVTGRVLDVNLSTGIVDISLRPELMVKAGSKKANNLAAQLKLARSSLGGKKAAKGAVGIVQLVKAQYVVVAVEDSHIIGTVAVSDYNTVTSDSPFERYKAGMRINVTLETIDQETSVCVARVVFASKRSDGTSATGDSVGSSAAKGGFNEKAHINAEELRPGQLVSGKVVQILDLQMNLAVGFHLFGRVHVTEVNDAAPSGGTHPFAAYKVGDVVQAKVMSIKEVPSNRMLPISHQNPIAKRLLELTLKSSDLQLAPPALSKRPTWETLKKGQQFLGYVHTATQDAVWVHISTELRGRVFLLDCSTDIAVLEKLPEHFPAGRCVEVVVKALDAKKKSLDLAIVTEKTAQTPKKGKKAKKEAAGVVSRIKEGATVVGRIAKVIPGEGLRVQVDAHEYGRVYLTDIDDKFGRKPLARFEEGQFVHCYVLARNKGLGRVDLSLRRSRVSVETEEDEEEIVVVDREVDTVGELMEGEIVRGYVAKGGASKKAGVFVALSRHVTARVMISDLSDDYIKDPAASFPPGTLVKGKVTSVDTKKERVDLSLKHTDVSGKKLLTLADLKVGMKVKGFVRRVEPFGVFVTIKNGQKLSGLCHHSELLDGEPTKKSSKKAKKGSQSLAWQKLFDEGDYVKAVVLAVDMKKKQISLGMKPSYFTADDVAADSSDEEEDEEDEDEVMQEADGSSDDSDEEMASGDEEDSEDDEADPDDDVNMEDSSEDEDEDESEEETPKAVAALSSAPGSGDWDDFSLSKPAAAKEEESDDESEEEEEEEKQSKRSKKNEKQKEEAETRKKEEALMDDSQPKTIGDYEKLVATSPNSSFVWIKYVAYLLSIAEVSKASAVVERGLKRIHYREEEEKLNLWVAYMNLEHHYGSQESLMTVVERALQYNDPKEVYLRLINIYEQSGKYELAEEVYTRLTKKYKTSSRVWIRYGTSKMMRGDAKGAREVLQQALVKLPKAKHVPVVLKFAQLEYKNGHFDHARTLFEGFVSNYPKRVDLWSVYADMEIKYVQDIDVIRHVFERACSLGLSSKKMKFLINKYLTYEKKYGDETSVDHVKQKARDYLDAKTGAS